jgi:iron complex transport system substrate-binding protein
VKLPQLYLSPLFENSYLNSEICFMFRRWIAAGVTLLLSLVLVACATATTPPANTAQKVASRVITLTSLTSDIVANLDKTKLVGIGGSRLMEKDARFKDIPRVSQGQTPPSLEKIVALKPDLVVVNEEFHAQLLPKLKELNIPTLSTNIKKWDDLASITESVARSIGADSAPLLARYQSFLGKPAAESPSTLVLVSRQPILAPNKNSWAGDLLEKVGAKNLVADLQGKSPVGGYVTLSPEKILEANPEVLLVVDMGQGIVEEFKSEPFWSKLKATQNNRVYVFDYFGLVNPGSIDKIEAACKQLREVISAKI